MQNSVALFYMAWN